MRFLTAAALSLGLAAPASALDLSAMSEAERTAFGAAVRGYLLENPEVLMEAIGVLEQRQQEAQAMGETEFLRANADTIFNNPADWAGGNPEGDLTLVEFVDYRCGYCRKAWTEVEELVRSDGNIRLVMKEFPILGEDSLASSKFAIAARNLGGDEVYKKAHDALISLKGPANEAALSGLAKEIGLAWDEVKPAMEAPETLAVIGANQQLASSLQINGTPTFILRETMLRGYVPLDGMRQIVSQQREAAKAAD
ncbi:DsbA family protein [Falsigemmobacter intermedius]|uniref:DsbA family protein n=1 Tax=Falsigemmobacter intermedius TaxID=1553448 RepID=A0A3S3UDB8_9RHOB|nr:DsbA family protein [Falsigemmobacter intermedius]RWY41684.1 DsbA family protein [Falsigemmobacter intermedius]